MLKFDQRFRYFIARFEIKKNIKVLVSIQRFKKKEYT